MKYSHRVLIVDDDPDFTQALEAALKEKSYSVVTASERRQAEDMVRSHEPELIVLGAIMPRGDAFLFHQWIKQSLGFSNLPVIVVNTPPAKQHIKGWRAEEGMQCDAEDFLSRPIELTVLVPRIEKLLDRVTKKIRVLVVDDHAVVRDGIRAVLALQRDMQVVGEAIDGREAVDKTEKLLPDVVLMDIVMPGMNGLEATKEICRQYQQTKVLMLTQYDDEENVLASQQAGALGFIPKTVVSSQLLNGIRSVYEGKKFIYTFDPGNI
jgi:DNA-binding NarL/FixJ family response regulator